jgi:hypothetical protein
MDLRTPEGKQELGRRIQAAIAEAGYESLPAFATRLGCSRALIYQYVKGDVLVQLDRLQTIAELTDRPLAWFLLGEASLDSAAARDLREELEHCRAAVAAAEQALGRERERRATEADQYRQTLAQDLRELCLAYRRAGDAAALLEACPRWLELARERHDRGALLAAHLHMGHAWYQVGNLDMALRALQEALRLARETADRPAEYSARQELIRVLQGLGRSGEAREQALSLAQADRWWPRWAALVARAALEEQTGHLPAAEQALAEAEAVVESASEAPDRRLAARAYVASNRVNLALARGHYRQARELSDVLQDLASAAGLPDQLREAALDMALADLRGGHLPAAGERLERLAEWAALAGDQRIALLAALFHAEYRRRRGELSAAKQEAFAARERAGEEQSGALLAEAELAMGEIYRAEGAVEEALHYLQQSQARAERLELHRLAFRAALSLAQLEGATPPAEARLRELAEAAQSTGYMDLHAEALLAQAERSASPEAALQGAEQAAALAAAGGDWWGEQAAAVTASAAHLRRGDREAASSALLAAVARWDEAWGVPLPLPAAERSLAARLLTAYAQAGRPAPEALVAVVTRGETAPPQEES